MWNREWRCGGFTYWQAEVFGWLDFSDARAEVQALVHELAVLGFVQQVPLGP